MFYCFKPYKFKHMLTYIRSIKQWLPLLEQINQAIYNCSKSLWYNLLIQKMLHTNLFLFWEALLFKILCCWFRLLICVIYYILPVGSYRKLFFTKSLNKTSRPLWFYCTTTVLPTTTQTAKTTNISKNLWKVRTNIHRQTFWSFFC